MSETLELAQAPAEIVRVQTTTWIATPHHPWRRLFARCYDYTIFNVCIAMLFGILVEVTNPGAIDRAIERMPPSGPASQIIPVLVSCISTFLIALCVARLGHSPGKWLFGITVERKDGNKLTYVQALKREFLALFRGMFGGYYLFPAGIIAGFLSYDRLKKKGETAWDERYGTRVLYLTNPNGRIMVAVVPLILVILIGVLGASLSA